MKRRVRIITTVYLCFSLLLSFGTGAGVCVVAESGRDEGAVYETEAPLLRADGMEEGRGPRLNERLTLPPGESALTLETDLTGEYTLAVFSSGEAEARVTCGGETLAQGMLPLTVDLRAGQTARVELRCEAEAVFEWMRAALGRSAFTPIELELGELNRSLTRAFDVHWFRFTASEAGEYLLEALRAPRSGVRAGIMVMGPAGEVRAEVSEAEDASAAFVRLEEGESCLIRVCAAGAETGNYTLSALKAEAGAQALTAARAELELRAGEWTHVSVAPDTPLIWHSDNAEIATVSSEGVVAAQGVGACEVTARASGGRLLRLPVTVSPTQVQGVAFRTEDLNMAQGEEIFLDYGVLPAFARGVRVGFASEDESVARVSADGLLTAVGVGQTTITVQTEEGGFSDRLTVTVGAPRPVRRALLVGIASYADGRTRLGSVNTTQGVADALAQSRSGEGGYQTTMRIDLTKEELKTAISQAFSGATANDISLFYINCHGGMFSGLAFLELQDGSRMSARELERTLRAVPGTVVVVLDCCFSGAFIGKSGAEDSFAHGVVDIFSGRAAADGANAFAGSKYKVLVSSSQDQNSYRMASSSPATEGTMSTVFARAFTEALGWDLIKDQPAALRADLDDDRAITLSEAFLYVRRRTLYYLTRSPASTARQCAQLWPEGDTLILLS